MNTRDLQAVLHEADMMDLIGEYLAGQLAADHALAEELLKPEHERDDATAERLLEECRGARGPGRAW